MFKTSSGIFLPTFSNYIEFSETVGTLADGRQINAIGQISHIPKDGEGEYIMVDDGQKQVLLMPAPEFNVFLYRGENEFHSPCQSSALRLKNYTEYTVQFCKMYELYKLLQSNAAIKKWMSTYETITEYKMPFCIDRAGLL